ncbi:MAG: secretin N-terminal domain-containing protein [Phycisphaerales bacterium]
MERSKIILWGLVLVAAGAIIWWVGFHASALDFPGVEQRAGAQSDRTTSGPNEPNDARAAQKAEPNAPQGEKTPEDANKPAGGDPNQPEAKGDASPGGEPPKAGEAKPSEAESAKPKVPEDPNDPLEAVNLKDVEMKNIVEKIAQWTGKVVIPNDEAMKQKITIYAPDKLPRSKALLKIYSALRMKGFMPEEVDDTIFLKPLSEAKLGVHPIVPPDQPLAAFENPDQVVQKLFKLNNYPPAQMGEIVRPLVSEFGHVGADETTGTLLVIDTVGSLMRIENIIAQFDVPDAGNKMITEIFEIRSGDPTEMVQLLRLLLGGSPDGRRGQQLRSSGTTSRPASQSSGGSGKSATSVVIAAGDTPIILVPEPKRKWIIARSSAENLKQIGEWIEKMDREQPIAPEYETVSIVYADVDEVARRIQQSLEDMPGTELRPNVLVQALSQSRQIMIFGRADLREMVKKLIAEVDVMPGLFLTEVFQLEHADPDQIKTNLEGLYESQSGSSYSYGYRSSRYRNIQPSETVKVISYPSMGQVTVIASAENMEKIRKQIKEWDIPLDVETVKPRIIELQNSDPVQMATLLRKLFSEESDSTRSLFRMIFWDDEMDTKQKIVGPLYGQLTFEDVPGTKKIIVISKIPQAYAVIEQLILDLDRQEMAEVPHVVEVKYADTEDLAERLNATFNEAGTNARIRRTTRGLGDYSMNAAEGSQNQGNARNTNQGNNNQRNDEYTPPWSSGGGARRGTMDEEPISNVIGRVRFIPDPRSKSILVLAPPEFQSSIEETIKGLDVPGKQVLVKAVVVEVDHQDLTSLGLQLSSNPAEAFSVGENAVTALSELTYLQERGSATLSVNSSVTALLDFLVKKVDAQILNQQSLWTEDNEEASFSKGQKIAFQTNATTSETGISRTQNFEYQDVGMTLAVRPSITPEKNVDMNVTVLLSDLTGDSINGQPVRRFMESTTNMIVENGQTLMLGGILFQTDSKVVRKVPLFGDLPLVGGLFRHNNITKANNELIVFITPYVMDKETSAEADAQIEEPKKKLDTIQGELNQMSEELQQSLEKP